MLGQDVECTNWLRSHFTASPVIVSLSTQQLRTVRFPFRGRCKRSGRGASHYFSSSIVVAGPRERTVIEFNCERAGKKLIDALSAMAQSRGKRQDLAELNDSSKLSGSASESLLGDGDTKLERKQSDCHTNRERNSRFSLFCLLRPLAFAPCRRRFSSSHFTSNYLIRNYTFDRANEEKKWKIIA